MLITLCDVMSLPLVQLKNLGIIVECHSGSIRMIGGAIFLSILSTGSPLVSHTTPLEPKASVVQCKRISVISVKLFSARWLLLCRTL
jgi:hypothetical protein